MSEAALQAELMKQFQAPLQDEQQQPQGMPLDPTGAGGGNIGTGQVPVPGEQGFSGNDGQTAGNQPPQANGQQQPPVGSVQ